MPAVTALGKALTNPELKGTTFVLAGHTDATGGDTYNQDLSERRADSLKKYLMEKYGIAAADLVTVGYGKTKLKNASRPGGRREPPRAGRQHGEQQGRGQLSRIAGSTHSIAQRPVPRGTLIACLAIPLTDVI